MVIFNLEVNARGYIPHVMGIKRMKQHSGSESQVSVTFSCTMFIFSVHWTASSSEVQASLTHHCLIIQQLSACGPQSTLSGLVGQRCSQSG